MTVVNALRFNENSGAMVADAQSSYGLRKTNGAEKIESFADDVNVSLFGGAGVTTFIKEVVAELRQSSKVNVKTLAYLASDASLAIKRDLIGRELQSRLGIGPDEFLSGRTTAGISINPTLINAASDLYQGRDRELAELFESRFLLMGKESPGTAIYVVGFGDRPIMYPMPYATIGSGSEQSDAVLREYFERIPRDKRKDINFLEGVWTLFSATNKSSDVNQGVGGIPNLVYFKGKEVRSLDENASLLASEIVRVGDNGILERSTCMGGFERLVCGNDNFEKVEEDVFSKSPKSKEIYRFLRGYKN